MQSTDCSNSDFNINTGFKRIVFGNGKFVAVTQSGTDKGSPIISSTNGENWSVPVYIVNSWDVINDVTFGNGVFVAVGDNNNRVIIATSINGENWSAVNTSKTGSLYRVAYGNGKFVAGSMQGEISISTDGKNWSELKKVHDMQIMHISYSKGKFIMLSIFFNPYGRFVLTSIDGENWSEPQLVSNQPLSAACAMP